MKALAAGLRRLHSSPDGVPSSLVTRAQRSALEIFAHRTGAVRFQRRGAGYVLVVKELQVVERHLDELSPHWRDTPASDLPQRARNIAMTRSSKGGVTRHDVYHLLLKPVGHGSSWTAGPQQEARDLRGMTAATGAAVIPISPDDGWHTNGDLWLVENQALFDRLDWLPADASGSVSYFGGEIHGLLLRWLAASQRAARVIVFPDYDGNGLSCFLRVAKESASACELYLLPGWENALDRYGNPAVHRANLEALEALAISEMDPLIRKQVAPVLEAMIRTGRALEQEAAWLCGDDEEG